MQKKILSLSLVFILLLSICSFAADESDVTITIAHTNDTHSRVFEGSYDGMGFAKLATEVENLKSENPNFLLLDAGDALHGQTISTLVNGESIIDVFNTMGYDAMTAGNHDFNYGQERLVELAGMANFPILSSNVVKEDGSLLLENYIIKDIAGIKVGIFGLTTPETTYKTHPDNVKGLTFKDPIETAKEVVSELSGQVDVIICLAHIGLDEESEITSDLIAEAVPEIDVIIDGHSHTVLPEGMTVNGVLIAQTGEYDKNLGIITLKLTDNEITSKTASLFTKEESADLAENETILKKLNEITAEQEKITSVVIGKADFVLEGERENVRAGETNLGNLITNAMIKTTGADIAITNGGGIRSSVDVGDITKGEIITVLPFGNYIITKDIKGSDVKAAIEHGISDYPELKGAFPHVAGLSFTFDPSKEVGSKVVSIYANGEALDLDKIYTVATNDFMAAGGDDYTMFKDYPIKGEYPALDEAVINYIQNYSVKGLKVENRVVPVKGKGNSYIVKSGDLLWKIAKEHNTTWEELAKHNKLKNPNMIIPGQELEIPAN